MRDKDLLKLLLQNGWHVVNINGSHHKLRKGNATEIIPIHGKGLLHERPYRLAALATSPVVTGEAKMP